jgi:opacity protein-like surface antigen
MSLRTILSVVALGTVVCAGVPAGAEEEKAADYARRGAYLGMGALYAFEDFDLPEIPGVSSSADDSWGFDARAGYRYRYAALETQFQYYDEFTLDANGSTAATINAQSFSVNLKGYPLGGPVQPYLLAGFGFLRTSSDAEGTGATRAAGEALFAGPGRTAVEFIGRFGGGLDAYVTPNVVVYVEGTYLLPKSDLNDFNVIPLAFGVQYRFD